MGVACNIEASVIRVVWPMVAMDTVEVERDVDSEKTRVVVVECCWSRNGTDVITFGSGSGVWESAGSVKM